MYEVKNGLACFSIVDRDTGAVVATRISFTAAVRACRQMNRGARRAERAARNANESAFLRVQAE